MSIDFIHPDLRSLALPIESLHEDPHNANQHSDASRKAIAASMIEFGQRKPIVVRREGMIVEAGNGTLAALRAAGWTHLACVVCDDDEERATAYALADNQAARHAAWNFDQLRVNVETTLASYGEVLGRLWCADDLANIISGNAAALAQSLNSEIPPEMPPVPEAPPDKLAELPTDVDEIPDTPPEPITQPGEVVELGPHTLHCCDCMDLLRSLPDNSIDAIVTDPPYGLSPDGRARTWDEIEALRREGKGPKAGFMGREWDAGVPGITWARECLRVLKPGGHLIAHSATRTIHRLACAVEDAGFELRDSIHWMYYCLTDDVEILTSRGWLGIDDEIGDAFALCYSIDSDTFEWGPIQDRFSFEHDADLYRVSGDHGSHRITDGHRCVVERGAGRAFEVAEQAARQLETRIPVVEDLRGLLGALPYPHEGTSPAESKLLASLWGQDDQPCQGWPDDAAGVPSGDDAANVQRMCSDSLAAPLLGEAPDRLGVLFPSLQRQGEGASARPTSETCVDRGAAAVGAPSIQWSEQPGVEGRRDVAARGQGQLQGGPLRPMSGRMVSDGEVGWLHHGTPLVCGEGTRSAADSTGMHAPYESRSAGQSDREPRSVRVEPGSQDVRGSRHTVADLVRFEREHYAGRVWCVKVPTGAFVARARGSLPFVTGNSGFPKSLDVSKAIDASLGATREVVGRQPLPGDQLQEMSDTTGSAGGNRWTGIVYGDPVTEDAKRWDGWGTALKPAIEPAVLARKPLSEATVAANVLRWGTGAINIDACRYADGDPAWPGPTGPSGPYTRTVEQRESQAANHLHVTYSDHVLGRWPANIYACPKPATSEREAGLPEAGCGTGALRDGGRGKVAANVHPTVKPTRLYRWLLRLVAPPGGTVLEPFGGSGTTLVAATGLDCSVIAAEREPAYCDIIRARVEHSLRG